MAWRMACAWHVHACHLDLRTVDECGAPPRALHFGDSMDEELDALVDCERLGVGDVAQPLDEGQHGGPLPLDAMPHAPPGEGVG
tara:strand:+ start:423 stop:674 length:252 start_codon:yes stop_codon:yes gene_type:complete